MLYKLTNMEVIFAPKYGVKTRHYCRNLTLVVFSPDLDSVMFYVFYAMVKLFTGSQISDLRHVLDGDTSRGSLLPAAGTAVSLVLTGRRCREVVQ